MTLKKLTLLELFESSCEKFANNLSNNFYQSAKRTYSDLHDEVISLANYLLKAGIKKGDKVGILSANMPNWGVTQLAIARVGAIYVPILPGFCTKDIENILNHSETKMIFVSDAFYKLLADIKTDYLERKILINNFIEIPKNYPIADIQKLNVKNDITNLTKLPNIEVEEEDTLSIIYTSGTTGFSKGVELTNKNIVWDTIQCNTVQPIVEEDRFLSVLPMAHTFENTLGFLLPLYAGASVYYIDRVPSPNVIMQAIKVVKPTLMLTVPLIIEKIYRKQILPKLTKNKFLKALYSFTPSRKIMNYMAGRELMKQFGGEIKFFGIGGAKLDPIVWKFLIEAKFPYAIGYGLTETAPMSAGTNPNYTSFGNIGYAMDGVELKINNPDENGEGEIWIKGPQVMKGYYKRPELTAEVLTKDGWFKTGDLGGIDKKGRYSIRGRIKTMILGASGENIYPEEIESIINNFSSVNESLVVETKGKLVAMVHFNMEEVEKKFEKLKMHADSYKESFKAQKEAYKESFKAHKESYKATINEYLEDQKKELFDYVNSRVSNFSKVQMVMVTTKPFEKTPTHKIKRFLYQNPKS